jgi:hypothetical protein
MSFQTRTNKSTEVAKLINEWGDEAFQISYSGETTGERKYMAFYFDEATGERKVRSL